MDIKFSIILPTYNCKYLERAIDSVINQNYRFWELIIIDNHSKHDVLKVIKNKKNRKIKYLKNKIRIIGKSRNLGILKSKYTWIAFLDSDDLWYPNKLEEIRKKIVKCKKDFFFHNMHVNNNDFQRLFKRKLYYGFKDQLDNRFDDLIINGNDIIQSSVVVKKKLIEKAGYFSESKDLMYWEDFDLWLRISQITNKFQRINECLGQYFISRNKKTKHSRFIKNITYFEKKYRDSIRFLKKKYKLKNIWWIQYAKSLDSYNKNRLIETKKILDEVEVYNKRIRLNIIYIRFKIFIKELLKK